MSAWSLITLVLRWGLALVFAAAAVGKLRDLSATATAAGNLGVPSRLARPVVVGLPIVEAAVAVGLVVSATAGLAAATALGLVVVFSTLVGVQLARGRRPDCNCFGSGTGSPIGTATLVRNGAIAVVAGAIVARWSASEGRSLGFTSDLSRAQIVGLLIGAVALAAFFVHSWVLVGLLRQRGELLERVERLEAIGAAAPSRSATAGHGRHARRATRGLAVGAPAPRFALLDVDSRQVTIDDLVGGTAPTAFVFLEPQCAACVALADEVGAGRSELLPAASDPVRRLVAIVHGERDDVAAKISPAGFAAVLVDQHGEVSQRYGVAGTPSAVLVTPRGLIGSPLAEGRMPSSRLVWSDTGSDAGAAAASEMTEVER